VLNLGQLKLLVFVHLKQIIIIVTYNFRYPNALFVYPTHLFNPYYYYLYCYFLFRFYYESITFPDCFIIVDGRTINQINSNWAINNHYAYISFLVYKFYLRDLLDEFMKTVSKHGKKKKYFPEPGMHLKIF